MTHVETVFQYELHLSSLLVSRSIIIADAGRGATKDAKLSLLNLLGTPESKAVVYLSDIDLFPMIILKGISNKYDAKCGLDSSEAL
jgi:hypothetical protein